MIEILFAESEAALMKIAKEKGAIEGDSEKVICFNFMLHMGDIQKDINSDYRQKLIFHMYTQSGYDNTKEDLKELKEGIKQYINEEARLIKYLSNKEKVRIWYSNTPYDMCGFYYICDLMRNIDNEICAVKMPNYIEEGDVIFSYQSFGEVAPEKLSEFLKYEKNISQIEKTMFANEWCELKRDNSPLRTVINGKLMGVREDFYDYLIYKHLGRNPVKEVVLIGEILSLYPLGMGDWFYAVRIEKMINLGKIKIVEDCVFRYERIIEYVDKK